MISIIVSATLTVCMHCARMLLRLLFALVCIFPICASAEWLTVEMEGAKEQVHLDTLNGALYIGSDCTPAFYFSEALQNRSKSSRVAGKYYRVEKTRSRKLNKSVLPSRLPTAIVVDGTSVQIISESMIGRSQAQGKVKTVVIANRKKASQCK